MARIYRYQVIAVSNHVTRIRSYFCFARDSCSTPELPPIMVSRCPKRLDSPQKSGENMDCSASSPRRTHQFVLPLLVFVCLQYAWFCTRSKDAGLLLFTQRDLVRACALRSACQNCEHMFMRLLAVRSSQEQWRRRT